MFFRCADRDAHPRRAEEAGGQQRQREAARRPQHLLGVAEAPRRLPGRVAEQHQAADLDRRGQAAEVGRLDRGPDEADVAGHDPLGSAQQEDRRAHVPATRNGNRPGFSERKRSAISGSDAASSTAPAAISASAARRGTGTRPVARRGDSRPGGASIASPLRGRSHRSPAGGVARTLPGQPAGGGERLGPRPVARPCASASGGWAGP